MTTAFNCANSLTVYVSIIFVLTSGASSVFKCVFFHHFSVVNRPESQRCCSLEALASNDARTLIRMLYSVLNIARHSKACML